MSKLDAYCGGCARGRSTLEGRVVRPAVLPWQHLDEPRTARCRLVDRLEVMVFPVITGVSGTNPILAGLPDIDLELVDSRLYDGRVQQLVYVPTVR